MTNPYERRDNPFALVWNWLAGNVQQVLEVFHLNPQISNLSTEENGLRFRKLMRKVDKKMEARRLGENSAIKDNFIQERHYEREQLLQQSRWQLQHLAETSDATRKEKIQAELEAIKCDIEALLNQEKELIFRFEAWKSAHLACEKPAKEFRRSGKQFATSKSHYQKSVKDHDNVDKARLQMKQAQKEWEKAQHHWVSASKRERIREKEFEMAAAVAWPKWKSEAGSLTMQMIEAA
ncbi:MAG: hypothetical protein LLG04_12755 [Parachlamydia sp.]|nr:hypothetical protein [Parachlamydia sp.]